jgi:hypothetical protein
MQLTPLSLAIVPKFYRIFHLLPAILYPRTWVRRTIIAGKADTLGHGCAAVARRSCFTADFLHGTNVRRK